MDKKELQKAFGRNVKKYRQLNDMSQENLAFTANISTIYYGAVERGEKCPSLDTIYKLSKALQISPSQLLDFENEFIDETEACMVIKSALKDVPVQHRMKLAKAFGNLASLFCEVGKKD